MDNAVLTVQELKAVTNNEEWHQTNDVSQEGPPLNHEVNSLKVDLPHQSHFLFRAKYINRSTFFLSVDSVRRRGTFCFPVNTRSRLFRHDKRQRLRPSLVIPCSRLLRCEIDCKPKSRSRWARDRRVKIPGRAPRFYTRESIRTDTLNLRCRG